MVSPLHTHAPAVSSDTLNRAQALQGHIVAAAFLGPAAAACLYEAVNTADQMATSVVWGSLALAAWTATLLCLTEIPWRGGRLARWKLGPWMLLWYCVAYGLTTVTWSHPQSGILGEIATSSVMRALWLMAAAVAALTAGYLTGPGDVIRRFAARRVGAMRGRYGAAVRSPAAPWILYAMATAARLLSATATGRFGYVGNAASAVSSAVSYGGILGALSLCAPLAISAAALRVYRDQKPGAWVTLAILFAAEVASGAIAGGKGSYVTAVLAVAIPYSASRRRIPKASLALMALVFLVVVIPFNQAYRATARQGSVTLSATQSAAAAPGILRDVLSGHSIATAVPASVDLLGQRLSEIGSPAVILQRTPGQIPFASPLQLITAPAAEMVPRLFWPGKPVFVTGYQFSQEFFGLPSTLYTSSADTMAGGLYWHGGWVPLAVGMFLVGCGVRLADDVLDVRGNPQAIFLVLLLFSLLGTSEEDWGSVMGTLPATLCVWVLAVALTFRRAPAA